MSPERWTRVKDVLHAALEQSRDTRTAFLDRECRDDAALRVEVESLLAAFDGRPLFIEVPALAVPNSRVRDDRRLEHRNARIGAYRLIEPIASGGMGTVYLAERADAEYRQRVAIKLLHDSPSGSDAAWSNEAHWRFQNERQTLANLEHPNIARLLDGGATPEGAPFFVMEYVEGRPIDVYCDAKKLNVNGRLTLFRTVCAAVQFAHRNLVIHRDLKPANILVTAEGVPKLLDFGIAKLLDADSSDLSLDHTQTGLQPMTPSHASPEQVRGQAVTTSTDVYSLGVVLYGLISGHPPYLLAGLSPQEATRVICERPPDLLTCAGRRVRGDLELIILTALHKEPSRRYSSVEQLSEDIRRYLDGHPISARGDTLGYRAAKFIRRHVAGVTAVALVTLALGAGLIGTTWQARIAMQQRAAAQRAARTAEEVSTFLVELFSVPDPVHGSTLTKSRGTSVTAGEILAGGARRIADDLKDAPEIQARLMDSLGRVYLNLGDASQAEPLLTDALAIRDRTFGPDHVDVAASLSSVGRLRLAQGRLAEAEESFRQSLIIRRRHLGEDSTLVAVTLSDLSNVLRESGRLDESRALSDEALQLYRRLSGHDSDSAAVALGNYASWLHATGQLDLAEQLLRESLDRLRALHGDGHPDVARSTGNLGALLIRRGKYSDALPLMQRAIEMQRAIHGPRHPDVAAALGHLAAVHEALGEYSQAARAYDEALVMQRELLGNQHPSVAETLNNLGHLHYVRGEFGRAADTFREALAIRRTYAAENPALALSLHNLASALNQLGGSEAEPLFNEALAMRRRLFGDDHPDTAETIANLGAMYYAREDFVAATPLLKQALDTRRKWLGADHPATAEMLVGLAAVLRDSGNLSEAEPLQREALELQRRILPAGNPGLAASLTGLGQLLVLTDRAAEAEPLLREALEIRRKAMPAHWITANTASVLGSCLAALGRIDEAGPLVLDGYSVVRAARGDNDARTRQARQRVADYYTAIGDQSRAAEYRAQP